MKIVLQINPPSRKRILQWAKCTLGLHQKVTLNGRESDGVRSRQTIRTYCSRCETAGLTKVGAWFLPETPKAAPRVRGIGK